MVCKITIEIILAQRRCYDALDVLYIVYYGLLKINLRYSHFDNHSMRTIVLLRGHPSKKWQSGRRYESLTIK